MKKFIIIIILCMLLCSCGTPTQVVPECTQQSSSASNSAAVVTDALIASKSPMMTASPVPTQRSNNSAGDKSIYVTDMTGEKHKLKVGNIDANNKGGAEFSQILATAAYSQVVDDHYYFMR